MRLIDNASEILCGVPVFFIHRVIEINWLYPVGQRDGKVRLICCGRFLIRRAWHGFQLH